MTRADRLGAFAVAVGAPLLLSACVVRVESSDYTTREEKRFPVSGTPQVTLATFDGSIAVRAWDRPEVLVEVEKAGEVKEQVDAISVVAEQEGDRIRVEVREPGRGDWASGVFAGGSRRARLTASVPRACNLLVRSGDGAVEAERLRGRVELRTGDGSVRAIDLDGDLHVETGDGSVKLQDVNGRIDVTSGGGSIFASGRLRLVTVRTNDGTVSLTAGPGSAMDGAWDISTGDGSVVVALPEGFDADIDASTGDGIVRIDDALGATGVETGADRRRLRATLGKGTHPVRIRSNDGSIRVRMH